MRHLSLVFGLAGLLAGAACVFLLPEETLFVAHAEHAGTEAATGNQRYACPMMDFIGTKPGDCPVCGMKLQLVAAGELNREQAARLGLQTSRVTAGPALATVRAYGAVRYDDRTLRPVLPRIGGRIVKLYAGALHAGTQVAEGEPLLDLYSPEAYSAQAELAAAVKLGDNNARQAIQERFARWNLEAVAQAILAGGQPVDTVTIRSPFAGQVVMLEKSGNMGNLPQVGEEVMADRPLLRLVDPQAFMVVIHVPEARAHWVRVGQTVHLASDDMGELPEVQATVSWVAPELNLEIRAREVHLHLRDPQRRLLAGSLVNARILAALGPGFQAADPANPDPPAQFVTVPKSAVLSTGVRHVAWKLAERRQDGRLRFELAPLALGPRLEDTQGNDTYIVRAGLAPGDEVATQGAFLLDSQAQLAGNASLLFPRGAVAPEPAHQH